MDIDSVYLLFPETSDCVAFLERVRWAGKPVCPHCNRKHSTPIKNENRHHCNVCNAGYSVTVRTVFHGTRLPLQKWFLAVAIAMTHEGKLTSRRLAEMITIDKSTAASLLKRIRDAEDSEFDLMLQITEKIIGPEYRQKVAFARLNLR